MNERWGVFAWWIANGVVSADVHNAFKSKAEATKYAATLNRDLYESIVICPFEHFDECWKLIGANVKGGSHA